MNWSERADLAEAMIPVAQEFAILVHDGDAPGIDAFLAAITPGEADAFAIALAAMVPVDSFSPGDLLAWVGGGPVPAPALPARRERWPRPGGDEPEPERHTSGELRDAHAQAEDRKRKGEPVPVPLAALEAEYHRWRRQVRAASGESRAA